jgi:hypothetical protein
LSILGVAVGLAAIATTLGLTASAEEPATPEATETASPIAETATPSPSPSPSPSPTATPTEVPPTATIESKYPEAPPQPAEAPGQAVEADPARVFTGTGECLYVRPSPGKTFEVEPFSCVPEGTLLWLSGPGQEVDGETWRYALGAGWVAIQYTQPAERPAIAAPGTTVTLWQLGPWTDGAMGQEVRAVRLDLSTGAVLGEVRMTWRQGGLGARNPAVSPSGRYVSVLSGDDTGRNTAFVGDLETGEVREVPGAYGGEWVRGDRLALTYTTCAAQCLSTLSVYDAAAGDVHQLTTEPEQIWPTGWLPDGEALLAATGPDGGRLVRLGVDGSRVELGTVPAAAALWEASVSPDGRYLFSPWGLDGLTLVEVESLEKVRLARAPQRDLGGKCGGSWSPVAGWIDEHTAFYHERSSSDRQDGITVVDVRTGERKVFPFFNVQDIAHAGNGLLVFSTWVEGAGDRTVTFVLDTRTGEAAPLFTGSGAVFGE